jgi:CRP-like cAMP-binding protein
MQLSSCYLFRGLSESNLKQIIALGQEIPIIKGQWLYRENEPAEHMFILKSGAVEHITIVNDVVELPTSIKRQPGNCFGTAALVPPHLYSLSARGAEDGTLLAINRTNLQKLIHEKQEIGLTIQTNLARHFLERLLETRQELKIHFKTLFKSVHP